MFLKIKRHVKASMAISSARVLADSELGTDIVLEDSKATGGSTHCAHPRYTMH